VARRGDAETRRRGEVRSFAASPYATGSGSEPVPIAERLARFIVELELDRVPGRVVEQAKLCLLDGLGAMLAGSNTESGAIARGLVEEVGGEPQAAVVGSRLRTSAPWAALANGIQAHALEVDDGHRYAIGLHSGATTLPAALAAAERCNSDGRELLAALIAGYQVAGRIGTAINPGHRYLGFHSTGTVGCFGAAAAAARLLKLNVEQTRCTLGIAGSQAGGVFEFLADGSTVKHLHAGGAAQRGILAALLAERGLGGPKTILEGREGFLHAFAREVDVESITSELDERWELDSVFFKLHAACAHCFAPIDAALELRGELNGRAVRRIEVRTYRTAAALDQHAVSTRQQAKFSIPYCVAAALVLGRATEEAFEPAALVNPTISDLATRVEVQEGLELSADFPQTRAAEVRLKLVGGAVLERRVDVPRGMPENPAEPAELRAKFRALADPVVGPERAAAIVQAVGEVESRSVGELVNLAALTRQCAQRGPA
jgi:2-methylcitrate dehydratase PrpD